MAFRNVDMYMRKYAYIFNKYFVKNETKLSNNNLMIDFHIFLLKPIDFVSTYS